MSDVVHNAQHDFWRPPGQPEVAGPTMVEVCDGCGTEFMVGAQFCHVCGGRREAQAAMAPSWTRFLEFPYIKEGLGLGTASLIAFFLGLGCVAGAAAVGMIYTMQTFTDFQAIQLYRMEWLMAAVVAFVAGILLKRTSQD
jgi:hypothetical protein